MDSPECSCRPQTAALQEKYDAFLRRHGDDEALLNSISTAHPDGATSAHLCKLETMQERESSVPAGSMARSLDFDRMVKAAEFFLFDKRMSDGRPLGNMNRPALDRVPPEDRLLVQGFAELLFTRYCNGGCLRCTRLIRDADREGEPGRDGQLVLRYLLGMFDREGEPIPRELRAWSARSRLTKPPPRGKGRPTGNWLRDRRIIYTVALFSYLTGRDPTRDGGSVHKSILDAVALAFRKNGSKALSYDVVRTVWLQFKDKETGVALGPTMLERSLEQDRKGLAARARAQR